MNEKSAVIPYQGINDMATAGKLVAQSGILGAKNPAEGFLVVATCHQTGMSYLEFMENYHIFHGRISKKADAMLASFMKLGGKFKLIERSPERAAIEMEYEENTYTFSLSWAQAKLEPFVYRGNPDQQMTELAKPEGERRLKQKYRTPRSRMQMLWARLVSDSVRAICPLANQGTYTPEEIEDFHDDAPIEVSHEIISEVTEKFQQTQHEQHETEVQKQPSQQQPQIDFTTCPIPGKMYNVKWEAMPTEHLQMALQINHESMQSGHYQVIDSILKGRDNNETDNGTEGA